jgi:hypothetical protein
MMLQRFQDEALERLSPNTLSVGAAPLVSGGGAGEIIGADGSVGTQAKAPALRCRGRRGRQCRG